MCSIEWCHFRWPWVTPNPNFKVTVQFKGEYLANGASNPLHVWFWATVFWVSRSNSAICGSIKSKLAADGHLGYTKMAITSQPVCRSTWSFILGGVFGADRYSGATFDDLEWPRTPVSRSRYSLKANILQMVHPIHYIFGSRLVFSGSAAERMALFPVR